MKIYKFILVFVIAGVILSFTREAEAQNTADTEDNGSTERIQVIGKRPLSLLKEEFMLAQYALFDTFNTLMEDPDMHYVCTREKRKGSNTRQKVCRDAFDIRIRRELLQEYSARPGDTMENLMLGSASAQLGSEELDTLKAKKLSLIKKLYAENTRFRDSFIEMVTAKQKYEASHQAAFGAASKFAKN